MSPPKGPAGPDWHAELKVLIDAGKALEAARFIFRKMVGLAVNHADDTLAAIDLCNIDTGTKSGIFISCKTRAKESGGNSWVWREIANKFRPTVEKTTQADQ